MKKEHNGMAVTGFLLSLVSLPLFIAGFLCMLRIMLYPFLALVFGEAAGLIALFGIILSAIGNARSYDDEVGGSGLSIAGLLIGTMVLTLVLSVAALWITTSVMGIELLPVLFTI